MRGKNRDLFGEKRKSAKGFRISTKERTYLGSRKHVGDSLDKEFGTPDGDLSRHDYHSQRVYGGRMRGTFIPARP